MLSLIIPTFNERQNIISLIHQVTATIKKTTNEFEVIVVDDDSPDGTWQVAQDLAKKNPHVRVIRRINERGLATGVVAGWKAARGEILGVMDADLQHPPETLSQLLTSITHRNADIAVASRHVAGGGIGKWRLIRKVISWGAAYLATLMLPGILRTVRDPMSGFFFIRRNVIESVNLKPEGFKILLEVLVRGNYRTVIEVPYVFEERRKGESKLGFKQYLGFLTHLGRLVRETGQFARFIRFCTVGLSGVFVNEGALKFFTEFIGLYYLYSSVLAVEIAIMNNFLLNEFWTFADRSRHRPEILNRLGRFVKFNLICALGGVLNVTALWALTYLMGIYYLISNLVGIGVATFWNYEVNANITWDLPIERGVERLS